jgi:type I restriction enzyme R subunit
MADPEQLARENIDALLEQCGWTVQDKNAANLSASRGVALRELSFKTGEPDYTLFVNGKAIGTVEAKPEGHSLIGVEEQSEKYVKGVPFGLPAWRSPLPFSYESTGTETRFTNRLDPEPRSRNVFTFHRPETLLKWAQAEHQLNQCLCELLPVKNPLWKAQVEAISNLEQSFADQQRIVAKVERRLSVVEELEAVVNANLQRAIRLRQSILQRAFSGEL